MDRMDTMDPMERMDGIDGGITRTYTDGEPFIPAAKGKGDYSMP
jgi:hypothetical protein